MQQPEDEEQRPPVDSQDGVLRAVQRIMHEVLAAEDRLPAPVENSDDALIALAGLAIGPSGHSFAQVAEALRALMLATPSSASTLFANQLFGGREPVATLAEMLTPLTNTSMYTFKAAGPQILIERAVLDRMAKLVGYDKGEGLLAPGGSLATLTAMAVARNEAASEIREHGAGSSRLRVYTSEMGHYSIRKNAGLLGIGRANVRDIATDGSGRMDTSALVAAIASDRVAGHLPMMVNATAGTTVLGAFDPLDELAEVARAEGLWLHVDGALGGSVLLSERHRHLLRGAHLADSLTWNPHKLMGVPLSCSALLVKRRGLLTTHLSEAADYLFQDHGDELNPGTRSIQCGRRNDALKLWAAWLYHGDGGYAVRIDHLFDLARQAARRIESDPELELIMRPESVNVCFRVRGASSTEICERLDREARLKIGHGEVFGRRAIRLVCVNPDLGEADIDRMIEEVKSAASELAGQF